MIAKRIILAAIGFYKAALSPWIGPRCRFYPSCSEYAYQAFQRHKMPRAFGLAVKRVLKCHPLHPGGVDPVP